MILHRIQELEATAGWIDLDTGRCFPTATRVLDALEQSDSNVLIQWNTITTVGAVIVDVLVRG